MGIQMLPQFIYWIVYMFIYNAPRECPFPIKVPMLYKLSRPLSKSYLTAVQPSCLISVLQQSVDAEGSLNLTESLRNLQQN